MNPDSNMDDVSMSTDAIDLPPDVHAQLDDELRFISGLTFDLKTAPKILSNLINGCTEVYANTQRPIDPTFNFTACQELLVSRPELGDDLKKAHRSGQYAEIRNWRECTTTHTVALLTALCSRDSHPPNYARS